MKAEVECAAHFVTGLLRRGADSNAQADLFCQRLCELLTERYHNHWHPEKPVRGSAYRCIRSDRRLDPVLSEAAASAQLSEVARRLLPCELTIWVDPRDVSYRIGEDGSVCALDIDIDVSEPEAEEQPSSDSYLGRRHGHASFSRQCTSPTGSVRITHADNPWGYSRRPRTPSPPLYTNSSFVLRPSKPRVQYRRYCAEPSYAPMHIRNAPLVSSMAS